MTIACPARLNGFVGQVREVQPVPTRQELYRGLFSFEIRFFKLFLVSRDKSKIENPKGGEMFSSFPVGTPDGAVRVISNLRDFLFRLCPI